MKEGFPRYKKGLDVRKDHGMGWNSPMVCTHHRGYEPVVILDQNIPMAAEPPE